MPLLRIYPKELKAASKTYLYARAYCSIPHKSQEVKATQVFYQWMCKQTKDSISIQWNIIQP